MQDSVSAIKTDLGGLDWDGWCEKAAEAAGEDGFAERLGPRHAALLIEKNPMLLVTFENYETIKARSGTAHPIGWELMEALGWSQLSLVSDGDTWFRDPRVYGLFDRLIDDGFFEDFEKVVFYGAGPGGYAAAAYSVAAPGARVLALQPQATLDPRVTEWDDRFRHMRRVDFTSRFGYAPDMLDAAERAVVIYDPRDDRDAMHAALFVRPNVMRARARFLGPELEAAFLEMQVLYRMLAQLSSGRLTEAGLARLLRKRRDYPAYQFTLLRQLGESGRARLVLMLCNSVLKRRNARPFRKAYNSARATLGRTAGDGSPGEEG